MHKLPSITGWPCETSFVYLPNNEGEKKDLKQKFPAKRMMHHLKKQRS